MTDKMRLRAEISAFQTLGCLTESVGEWALETFGGSEQIVPATIHMIREANEAFEAARDEKPEQLAEECADLVILAMALSAHAGFDLEAVFRKKMLENLDRKWNVPDHEGVIEHVREE